jgi:chemotaxis signal transduction protein
MVSQAALLDTLSVVRCGSAGDTYAIDMAWVSEIGRADSLEKDEKPDGSVGSLRHQGKTLRAFDLARLLGFGPTTLRVPHVIVLDGSPPVALLVDRVSQVFQTSTDAVHALSAIAWKPGAAYFEGVLRENDHLRLLLSPSGLIPSLTSALPPRSWLGARHHLAVAPSTCGAPDGPNRLVLFSVANPGAADTRPIMLGIALSQVLEILVPPPLLPVPGAGTHLRGLACWRDRPIPVIDLAERLGLASGSAEALTRLVIARPSVQHEPVGFLARSSMRILRLPVPHVLSRRSVPLDPLLTRAVVELKNETLVVPDLSRIASTRR